MKVPDSHYPKVLTWWGSGTFFTNSTVSQKQAVAMAEQYLSFMAFSKSGLIDQLEFEGFSTEDATYGVENISVDWQEQAVTKAEEYLDFMAFSRQGLIDQLVFEGFSKEHAAYAASQVGL
ncbi:Ltp family lipoprotein [Halobacillus aidingensis]|uniref:Host cell surface-exposed lipoprotein n=1 Tax=Halobacillus aidingensis TaxID=240303 RepID=A0A1H0QLT2_HALAD|nr:Ltp family lipoprotein [Halobacillus aidingensis]SDP18232.1 Host cell surface-exposed lipoprotein [Halobacillus aidingensis]